ncbi:MAG: Hpt domain-containing protein [Veillonellaceae bacterium]|jgi:HPt (histidine-containing phosphotransfer) domain-containing protein|nr:Hpt domain-containing protein [Veillonellaceae bacterium]
MTANRVLIDQELAHLIPGFLANRSNDIIQLTTALQQGDFEKIAVIGHTLKGIGGGYGFPVITDLGTAIQQAAKTHDSQKASELVSELKAYLESVEIAYE